MILVILTACGGDGPGTEPLSAADAHATCTGLCEHQLGCQTQPSQTLAECTARCEGDVVGWVRTDVFADYEACVSGLACGASESPCEVCQSTTTHEAYETRCREVMSTCLDPTEVDNVCEAGNTGDICTIAPAIVTEMTACLADGVCAAAVECLAGVYTAHNIDI